MTISEFEKGLKAACFNTYELLAPQDAKRFVVWHRYGRNIYCGDDRNVLSVPKVQIDIVTDIKDDFLVDDVCAALWTMGLSYTVESETYDPDYNSFRTILQTEVC